MAKKKNQGEFYPNCLFLARDGEGRFRWYDSDPFKNADGRQNDIDIAAKLEEFFGRCDMLNPIMIKIKGVAMQRCEAFAANIPVRIRLGMVDKHLRDHEGHIVEILQSSSDDERYIFNGVVMDIRGRVLEMRRYSLSGECSDGQRLHSLVVMDGVSPLVHEGAVTVDKTMMPQSMFDGDGDAEFDPDPVGDRLDEIEGEI